MRSLLDVSVLVALHDIDHVHHRVVADWLAAQGGEGWASCPLTQNGCLRVLSQPGYPNPRPIAVLWPLLARSFSSAAHAFWPDEVSLLDERRFRVDRIHGHRQLTDVYLLGLAVGRAGRFVSLDAGISPAAVRGAQPSQFVLLR